MQIEISNHYAHAFASFQSEIFSIPLLKHSTSFLFLSLFIFFCESSFFVDDQSPLIVKPNCKTIKTGLIGSREAEE